MASMLEKYTFLKLRDSGTNSSQMDSKAMLGGLKFIFVLAKMNWCPFQGIVQIWPGFIVT